MNNRTPEKVSILKRIFFFIKLLEVRLRFIVILLITALVVGYWDYIQNYYERWQRGHQARTGVAKISSKEGLSETAEGEFEYFCPMHPFVVRDHTGKCPICGMDLVQRKKGVPTEMPEGTLARVQVSPERVMQAGVQIEPVSYRLLTRTIRSYGAIELDETRVARIIARFPGRIEQLMVNAVGLEVKKGEPLASIYSPKFLSAGEEYIQSLSSQKRIESNPQASSEEKRRAKQIVEYARQRLILAGFTNEQLDSIAKVGKADEYITLHSPLAGTVIEKNVLQGDLVEEGTSLYTIADLSVLWVQVQIIESDISAIKVGMSVEITTISRPGEIFYGTVDFIYPALNTETRTVKARVVVTNYENYLKPGMYVNAVLRSPIGRYYEIDSSKNKISDSETSPSQKILEGKGMEEHKTHTLHQEGEKVEKKSINIELPTQTKEEAEKFLSKLSPGDEYYTCPMHPEVVSDKEGDCPKCGMHLEIEKVEGETKKKDTSNEIWAEGYACEMHIDQLMPTGGKCQICGCGMTTKKWRIEKVLSIPETAVIDTGTRYIVYGEVMAGVYDAYAVTLGPRADKYYQVLDGLTSGQRIVTRGSFLIDAEARLNPFTATESTIKSEHKHH